MVRLVVIKSEQPGKEVEWIEKVESVLALKSAIRERYSILREEGGIYAPPKTHNEFIDQGWRHEGQELEESALILDDEYGLISTADELLIDGCENDESKLIVLPWPADEVKDQEEIKKHVPDLRNKVEEKLKRSKEQFKQFKAKANEKPND